jgi:RimJ/RimL family protein N-acetyltransferase
MDMEFRPYIDTDWPLIWPILRTAFAAGDSYPCPVDMPEADAKTYWTAPLPGARKWVFVAVLDGDVVGTCYIRPDQGGLGDHICNCGYVVAETARGRGIASQMCRASQDEARQLGFSGMRFNLVVATNLPAIRAWEKSGLKIVGTIPDAFRHEERGFVDAHIMWMAL